MFAGLRSPAKKSNSAGGRRSEDPGLVMAFVLNSKLHNTIVGLDGKRAYLAGLGSPYLTVASTADHTVEATVGPFGDFVRPFTSTVPRHACLPMSMDCRIHIFDATVSSPQ